MRSINGRNDLSVIALREFDNRLLDVKITPNCGCFFSRREKGGMGDACFRAGRGGDWHKSIPGCGTVGRKQIRTLGGIYDEILHCSLSSTCPRQHGRVRLCTRPSAGQSCLWGHPWVGSADISRCAKVVRGGTLRVGLNADLTTMDPHMSTAAVDRQVYQSVYNPLLRLEKDLTIKPELAEKYEFTDPTTLVLTLRKGVKFHDGTDFNAQAVKANFDRMLDPVPNHPRQRYRDGQGSRRRG